MMRSYEDRREDRKKVRKLLRLVRRGKITEQFALTIAFEGLDFCNDCGSVRTCEHGERKDDA